jgi:hypothetical protein
MMEKKILVFFFSLFFYFTLISVVQAFNFEMEIKVSVSDALADNGKATQRLVAGGNQKTTVGFDPLFDVPALFLGDTLKASFPHPEMPGHLDPLWRDFREDHLPMAWTFEVSSNKDKTPITLQWVASVTESGCENVKFNLIDQTTGQVIDMEIASN